ncbi:MAG: hypothetical protein Q9195_009349, partial [Heterodermia aff. obscurata]
MPLIVPNSWRFQICSSFIPALALLLLVYGGSESPRWLIKKSRFAEAYNVLLRLRGTPVLAARDLILIRAQLNVETVLFMRGTDDAIDLGNDLPHLTRDKYQKEINLMGYGRRIIQLFTIPRVRRATLASFIVMSAQQLTGVNVFAFLASTLFEHAGFSHERSLWLFFGFGFVNFFFSALGYIYIDTLGRRFLLMASLAMMFPLLLATGFSFEASNISTQNGLVATFLILYTFAVGVFRVFLLFYNWLDVLPIQHLANNVMLTPSSTTVQLGRWYRTIPVQQVESVYERSSGTKSGDAESKFNNSEIFPQVLREVGMAWASGVCFMGAGILALTVPLLIHALGQTALMGLFAGLDTLALILVWLFVPGTERHIITMEEMNYVFGVATRKHMRYQRDE